MTDTSQTNSTDISVVKPANWPPLLWLAWGLLLVCAGWSVIHILASALDPLPYDYGEILIVGNAHRMQSDWSLANLYRLDSEFYGAPYQVYPPLFTYCILLISRLLFWLPHNQPEQLVWPELYAGRISTLIGLVAILGLIWLFVRKFGGRKVTAVGCTALFLCFHPVYYYAAFARVDLPALALAMGGLYIVLNYGRAEGGRVYWAILLFSLAFFTKQSLLAGAGASCLYLLWQPRWRRRGFIFTGSLVGVNLTGLILIEIASQQHFLFHILTQQFFPLSLNILLQFYKIIIGIYLGVWVGLLWGLKRRGREQPLFVIWAAITLLLTVTAAKVGSDNYYFQEIIAAGCIGLSLFDGLAILKRVTPSGQTQRNNPISRVTIYSLLLIQLLIFGILQSGLITTFDFREYYWPFYQEAASLIKEAGPQAEIFAMPPGPLLVAGRFDQIWDNFVYGYGGRQGYWNWEDFSRDVSRQRFGLIILGDYAEIVFMGGSSQEWPPDLFATFQKAYQLKNFVTSSNGTYLLYVYEPRPAS